MILPIAKGYLTLRYKFTPLYLWRQAKSKKKNVSNVYNLLYSGANFMICSLPEREDFFSHSEERFNVDCQIFGKRVREIRELRGMTQAQLAKELGINNVTVSRIETGVHKPNLIRILEFAQALDIPPYELLRQPGMDENEAIEKMMLLARRMPEPIVNRVNELLMEISSTLTSRS